VNVETTGVTDSAPPPIAKRDPDPISSNVALSPATPDAKIVPPKSVVRRTALSATPLRVRVMTFSGVCAEYAYSAPYAPETKIVPDVTGRTGIDSAAPPVLNREPDPE